MTTPAYRRSPGTALAAVAAGLDETRTIAPLSLHLPSVTGQRTDHAGHVMNDPRESVLT